MWAEIGHKKSVRGPIGPITIEGFNYAEIEALRGLRLTKEGPQFD